MNLRTKRKWFVPFNNCSMDTIEQKLIPFEGGENHDMVQKGIQIRRITAGSRN
jgi:hypothetical protein